MLIGWSNFLTLTWTAGATLLGLLFVVVTLGTDLSTSRKLDIARASMSPALYSPLSPSPVQACSCWSPESTEPGAKPWR